MRWVQAAPMRPHRCAVIPFIGNSNTKKGFFDTGQDLPGFDPHVYVSVEAVEQMAGLLGWQPKHVADGLVRQAAEKDRVIGDLRAQLAEADRELDAVEVLKGRGWSQAKKPGRPRKETV